MDAPQSDAEVRPVVDALQRIDPRLDVLWDPRAVIERRGGYDPLGKILEPTYGGRWKVILHDRAAKLADWREYTLICVVTPRATDAPPGVHALVHDGPYAPLGEWLVEYIRAVDRANGSRVRAISDAIDAAVARQHAADDAAHADAVREAADFQYDEGTREGSVAQYHPVGIDLSPTR